MGHWSVVNRRRLRAQNETVGDHFAGRQLSARLGFMRA
jgi:hypothetical protein